jgi:hypothetical protein
MTLTLEPKHVDAANLVNRPIILICKRSLCQTKCSALQARHATQAARAKNAFEVSQVGNFAACFWCRENIRMG